MNLTQEQADIITAIQQEGTDFLSVNAVSGSGKTSLLVAIAEALDVNNAMYIAYNKAIARRGFP